MSFRRFAALGALVAVLAACSPGPGSGGTLDGTDWVLQSYDVDGSLTVVPETLYADARFDAHRVSGFSGCNQFDALARSGGRTLLISQPKVTLMACDEEAMAFEGRYLALLQESRFYGSRRGVLTIYDGDARPILVFDSAPRNPLLGTWLVDSFSTGPGAVSAVADGTTITAVFGIASVGGDAGCNSYTGTYGTNGRVVRVGPLATTRVACEQPIMDQEAAYLTALQGAALIEPRAGTLLLTDRSGAIQVALVRPPIIEVPGASPSPEVTDEPTEAPTATPSPTATPTPTPTPTPAPTATPEPTEAPTPTPGPTLTPPPSPPATASCDLAVDGATIATLQYPSSWFTVTEPADLACRYFDPAEITVPDDPTTLTAAVTASVAAVPLAEAVAAATDPASWSVTNQAGLTIDGRPVTFVEAEATADTAGIPVGESSFAYLVDLGSGGTLTIRTTGQAGEEPYTGNTTVTTLMAATLSVPES